MAKSTKRTGSRSRPANPNRPASSPSSKRETDDTKTEGDKETLSASAPTSRSARPRPAPTKRTTPATSGRYTPPIPRSQKVSPIWVPVLMFACLGLGMITIIFNYVNLLPGPDPSNNYLMIGLGLITVGFITATKYH